MRKRYWSIWTGKNKQKATMYMVAFFEGYIFYRKTAQIKCKCVVKTSKTGK